MRGDATLEAKLLLRGSGIAGLAVACAGVLAMTAAYQPWYVVVARLAMLEHDQDRVVAELAGWQAHPWGWVVPALGLAAVVLGLGVALDRPVARARDLLLLAAVGLGMTVLAGALARPPVGRFDVAGSRLRELAELADRLPEGVALTFAVRPALGLWMALVAAGAIVVATLSARDLH